MRSASIFFITPISPFSGYHWFARIAFLEPYMTLEELKEFHPGLDALFKRIMIHILESKQAESLKEVLCMASVASFLLRRSELSHLAEKVQDYDDKDMENAVLTQGSFLNIEVDSIYFVHYSAKDFL